LQNQTRNEERPIIITFTFFTQNVYSLWGRTLPSNGNDFQFDAINSALVLILLAQKRLCLTDAIP